MFLKKQYYKSFNDYWDYTAFLNISQIKSDFLNFLKFIIDFLNFSSFYIFFTINIERDIINLTMAANDKKNDILKVKDLTKNFGGLKALNNLTFSIKYGDFFGLIGPNGAGKSTLLKILYGIVIPDSGFVGIEGLNLKYDYKKIKYSLGIVPQDDNLDEDLSVYENLLIYSMYFGIPKKESKKRSDELLHFFNLEDKRHSKVANLSGGLRRRLMIARALINNPSLIILDEPTSGLDPEYRQNIWGRLKTLNKNGVTILMSTHYMEEAEKLFKSVIILHRGNIVMNGTINDITLNKKSLEEIFLDIAKN